MKKYLCLVVACMMLLVSVDAFAYGHGGHGGGHGGGDRYSYRGGHWYRSGAFWTQTAVEALVVGAMINSLPPRIQPVTVNGAIYYTDGQYYYLPSANGGYVVVAPPIIQQPVQPVIVQPVIVQPVVQQPAREEEHHK